MEKNIYFTILFDIYEKLLTNRQKDIFSRYYNLDNSLSEIAETLEISRQSVRDSIITTEGNLSDFEEKLGFYKKLSDLNLLISNCKEDVKCGKNIEINAFLNELEAKIEEI